MKKSIYPGYTTTGIVVESDSKESQNIDRVKVRIYELHGASDEYSPEDTTISNDFTSDEDLPWIKVIIPAGFSLASKSLIYPVGAVVYVQFPSGNPEDCLVIGLAMTDNGFVISDMEGFHKLISSQGLSGNTGGSGSSVGQSSYLELDGVGDNKLFYNPVIDSAGRPLSGLYISSPFGKRILDGQVNFHTGVDLSGVGSNVKVYVSRDGTVERVCNEYSPDTFVSGSYGNCVLINHGTINGHTYYTRYAHLNRVDVYEGQTVKGVCGSSGKKQAQTLGLLGNTGHSYGSHLHFEILVDGTVARASYSGPAVNAVNPMNYITITG